MPDQAFFHRFLQSAVQGDMDQLDRAGTSPLELHPHVEGTDVRWRDRLQTHLSDHGQDVKLCIAAVVADGSLPAGAEMRVRRISGDSPAPSFVR